MSAAGRFLRRTERGYAFWCPGCDQAHHPPIDPGWAFDGNQDAPTFRPSILVRCGHYGSDSQCHSFVTGGQIQFLGDCSHALAGQTVPLPEWPLDGE